MKGLCDDIFDQDQYRPSTMNFWSWLNTESVRRSIHVGNIEFSDGLKVYMAMVEDTMRSIKPYLGKTSLRPSQAMTIL